MNFPEIVERFLVAGSMMVTESGEELSTGARATVHATL